MPYAEVARVEHFRSDTMHDPFPTAASTSRTFRVNVRNEKKRQDEWHTGSEQASTLGQ